MHGYRVKRERVLWEEGHWYTLFCGARREDTVSFTPGMQEAGVPARWCREPSRLPYLAYMEKRLERQRAGAGAGRQRSGSDRLALFAGRAVRNWRPGAFLKKERGDNRAGYLSFY